MRFSLEYIYPPENVYTTESLGNLYYFEEMIVLLNLFRAILFYVSVGIL